MTIVTPTIVPVGVATAHLSWTGTAGVVVRVFVNGRLGYGPMTIDTAAKQVDVAAPNPAVIEVHENAADETVESTLVPLERRPLLWWSSVPGVAFYRVTFGSQVLAVVPHEPSRLHHQVLLDFDLREDGGDGWTFLAVDAVTATGRSSSSMTFPFWAPGIPSGPSDVALVGTGGTFDVVITL